MGARPSPTAALLLLVLSLLAVAHCRALAAEHDTEPESTAAAVAVSDDSNSNPTLPTEAGAGATGEEALPAEQQHGLEFLRLPSHRLHRHRPCSSSLHRHLWWKRHHGDGVDYYRDAARRFHYSGHGAGERREAAVSHLDDVLSAAAEAASREAAEVKPVAEPDPDRSLSDSDGEGEVVAATRIEPATFVDTDGHDDDAAVRAWKKQMLRRWVHFRFHHGMRRHRLHHVHHHDGEEEVEEEAAPEGVDMKRFKFHHHEDEEDEEKNMARKRQLRHAEHDEDSDDEDEQAMEEMVRRFRKAIMRSKRFGHGHGHGHGRRFFHHHLHRHAEEGKKLQADGEEESGVMAWVKGLMNRF